MASMAADAGADDRLEIGALENTRTKRLKEIKKQQDSGDSILSSYPRTLKTRNERLLSATHCLDDYYMRKGETDEDEPIEINFKNCYLKSIDYLTDERKAMQTIKTLNKVGKDGLPKFKSLPIYLINGHSSVAPRLILEPPQDMSAAAAKEEQEFAFIDQLEHSNFSLHISPSTNNMRHVARDDFFNTNARSNKFVVTTTPIGFDAICGDTAQAKFLKAASSDRFTSLRDGLLSENFHEFFTRINTHKEDSSFRDDDERYFQNTMFFPPGYSVINKSYQFWDHDPNEKTRDKWGVIRLDTITDAQLSEGALDVWDPPITSANPQERLRTLHPLCPPKIKKTIIDSILNQTDVSLKEITDKLGAGIYLDFGCSGLVMEIFDPQYNKYKIISPDNTKNIKLFLPFYNVVQEGMEEINRYSKMSWNNIVSRKEDVELTSEQRHISRKSRRFRKDTTELQKASQRSRLFTEQHMKGGGKRKTLSRNKEKRIDQILAMQRRSKHRKIQSLLQQKETISSENPEEADFMRNQINKKIKKLSRGGKRKTRRKRKTKKKRGGNEQSANKIQKIVRGHQSRKKTIKRLSDNPFSGDQSENLLKTGSVMARENANVSASKTKLGQDVRDAMTKRIRTKGEKVKQQLLNKFPQFKEEINNITSLERILRQDSSEYRMTDAEKRARGLLGGKRKTKKNFSKSSKNKRKIKRKSKRKYRKKNKRKSRRKR